MITRTKAYKLRELIEKASSSLDDKDALDGIELYPIWAVGIEYKIGDRIRYDNILYKVLQDHTSTVSWTPDTAISLFARVLIPDPEVIPVWEQPDSTNPYMKGDKVHFPTINDPVYESLYDYNIKSPAAWPDGWKLIE